jgi:hypothetical protein
MAQGPPSIGSGVPRALPRNRVTRAEIVDPVSLKRDEQLLAAVRREREHMGNHCSCGERGGRLAQRVHERGIPGVATLNLEDDLGELASRLVETAA